MAGRREQEHAPSLVGARHIRELGATVGREAEADLESAQYPGEAEVSAQVSKETSDVLR